MRIQIQDYNGEMLNLHICIVVSEFPPTVGGVSYYTFHLCKALLRKGHRVTVLTRGSWKKSYYEHMEGINVYKIPFIRVYPFHVQLHGIFVNRIFKFLEDSFDVVHMHLPLPPMVHTSLPLIITVHGLDGDMHHLTSRIFSKFIRPFERNLLNNANLVTAVSSFVAREIEISYGFSTNRIEVIGNAVDTEFFIPVESKKKILYILFSGRLTSGKGLTDLLKSAEIVCKKIPSLSFFLAGVGPLEHSIRKIIKRRGLIQKIILLGQIDQKRLLEYYQKATVFVLPSHFESFPTVILEAMACGIPIVATAVGDVPKVVINGKTGFLVPPRDPEALAQAIIKIFEDKSLRKKMGENCRKLVESRYSWNALSDKIIDYYAQITGDR